MSAPTETAPLTAAEVVRLDTLLARRPEAMSVETMDGFFCALIAAPKEVTPAVWGPRVLGKDAGEGGAAEAEAAMALMPRRWNHIVATLERNDIVPPIFLDLNDMPRVRDWADGYVLGTRMYAEDWEVLRADEEHNGCGVSALLLYHDNGDPSRPLFVMTPERQKYLVVQALCDVVRAYRYFRSDRFRACAAALAAENAIEATRRGPRPGRRRGGYPPT